MKSSTRTFAALALALALAGPAFAANDSYYPDVPNNSRNAAGVATIPFPYTPLCPGSHGVSLATAATLTLPTGIAAARACATKVVTPRYAVACARTATVFYTTDGSTTPTATVSSTLAVGACIALVGASEISDFEAFSTTGTLDVEFWQ